MLLLLLLQMKSPRVISNARILHLTEDLLQISQERPFSPLVTHSAAQMFFKTLIFYLFCPENDTSWLTSLFTS